MTDKKLCFGLDGMDITEHNPFETDMCVFGGMTQQEIEAEADREEAESNI